MDLQIAKRRIERGPAFDGLQPPDNTNMHMPWRCLRAQGYSGDERYVREEFICVIDAWKANGDLLSGCADLMDFVRHDNNLFIGREHTIEAFFNLGFLPNYWGAPTERIAFDASTSEEVYDKFDGACAYCGRVGPTMQIDHVVPISRGGSHDMLNFALACQPCNGAKAAKIVWEWYQP